MSTKYELIERLGLKVIQATTLHWRLRSSLAISRDTVMADELEALLRKCEVASAFSGIPDSITLPLKPVDQRVSKTELKKYFFEGGNITSEAANALIEQIEKFGLKD